MSIKYINANALIREINMSGFRNKHNEAANLIKDIICDLPTADVRENVRGEWIVIDYNYDGEDEYPIIGCSECEYPIPEDLDAYNFCPNCGADMREEE